MPCILNISGAGFATNLQIWFLGTTLFDPTPLIVLRGPLGARRGFGVEVRDDLDHPLRAVLGASQTGNR